MAIASRCLRISSATDSIQAVFSLRSKTDAPNNAGAAGGSWRKTNRTPFPVKQKERMDEIAKKKKNWKSNKITFLSGVSESCRASSASAFSCIWSKHLFTFNKINFDSSVLENNLKKKISAYMVVEYCNLQQEATHRALVALCTHRREGQGSTRPKQIGRAAECTMWGRFCCCTPQTPKSSVPFSFAAHSSNENDSR